MSIVVNRFDYSSRVKIGVANLEHPTRAKQKWVEEQKGEAKQFVNLQLIMVPNNYL